MFIQLWLEEPRDIKHYMKNKNLMDHYAFFESCCGLKSIADNEDMEEWWFLRLVTGNVNVT